MTESCASKFQSVCSSSCTEMTEPCASKFQNRCSSCCTQMTGSCASEFQNAAACMFLYLKHNTPQSNTVKFFLGDKTECFGHPNKTLLVVLGRRKTHHTTYLFAGRDTETVVYIEDPKWSIEQKLNSERAEKDSEHSAVPHTGARRTANNSSTRTSEASK